MRDKKAGTPVRVQVSHVIGTQTRRGCEAEEGLGRESRAGHRTCKGTQRHSLLPRLPPETGGATKKGALDPRGGAVDENPPADAQDIRSLAREDPTCRRARGSVPAPQPLHRALEPVLCNRRSRRNEGLHAATREQSLPHKRATKTQHSQ